MNGVDALKEIKQINKKIVVIMMTAYAYMSLIKDAEKQASLVIDKPFNSSKILRTFERVACGEELEEKKIAIIGERSDSISILQKEGYNISAFQNFDNFLASVRGLLN
jgi:DNA-binding NtrC family response regulator